MSEQKKLSVQQVCEANQAIMALIDSDKRNKFILSSATRIKLAGNLRKTKDIAADYDTERQALVKELGAVDETTKSVTVKPENNDAFSTQLKAMLAVETDVVLNPITEAALLGVTEEEEKAGKKANQIDIDLIAFMQEIGLLTNS
jgi:hypothetical protein